MTKRKKRSSSTPTDPSSLYWIWSTSIKTKKKPKQAKREKRSLACCHCWRGGGDLVLFIRGLRDGFLVLFMRVMKGKRLLFLCKRGFFNGSLVIYRLCLSWFLAFCLIILIDSTAADIKMKKKKKKQAYDSNETYWSATFQSNEGKFEKKINCFKGKRRIWFYPPPPAILALVARVCFCLFFCLFGISDYLFRD